VKILHVTQGSPEWERARLGMPTASAFDRILTPSKLELSAQSDMYRNQLLAEWLVGYPLDFGNASGYSQRGTGMEAEARRFYEMRYDVDVAIVGFVLRDDGKVGGSPDGLVDVDGGVDLKCPAIHTHIGYMMDPARLAKEYRGQCQGYMYLTGRKWWDVLAYNPILPAVRVRIDRDDLYCAKLGVALDLFVADLDGAKEQLAPHRQPSVAEVLATSQVPHAAVPV